MSLKLITPPKREPIDLADLREHLRISDTAEDRTLQRLIRTVRSRCERATRRALITQTWDLYLDQWPTWDGYHGGRRYEPVTTNLPAGGYVEFPKAPLQSVTDVHYVDMQGNSNVWDPTNYDVDTPAGDYCRRGRLALGWVKIWPVIRPTMNAVRMRFVAGYGDDPTDVPDLLVQGMLLDAGTLFDIRGAVLAGSRAAAIEIPSTTRDIYLSFRSL